MTDYGHPLRFGTFITPLAATAHRVVELALLTEQVGLDLVTVQDHPYQAKFVDTWTLLSVIAARTERVTVAPNVANLPLRPPVVLARSVATLDLLSGGRVELGLGAGGFADAIAAVGGPKLTAPQRVDALEEALRIIRAVWDEDGARSIREDGEHYRVRGAHPGPRPAHDVEIWLGAYKPRMLRITGAHADGWLPSLGYADVDAIGPMNAAIDEAATDAGRDPREVRRLYNVNGDFGGDGRGFLTGPATVWVEQLAELTLTHGMSTYVLASDDPDVIRRFAAEVAPGVRELVAAERSGSGRPDVALPTEPPAPQRIEVRVVPGLDVVPTPDDGTRLSAERPWDESTRPAGPAPQGDRAYTPQEQAAGQHLVDVHDALRAELNQLRELVEQVSAGHAGVGDARSHIATMTLRQNNWTLGVYCASYCRIVTGHHSLEDHSVFPHLRSRDPRLAPVIDRLEAEHHVISDVLERVDQALVAMVSAPDGLAQVRAAVDLLTDTLLSHLAYEERELVEPLARLGFS
ncbi:LLM class flavin-dependent oxidoreductase [Angustibacter sp. Root456]|uniref:LLM class flavin-dependent oxidoreductase n=1 Tax=Angustibacter sp. Root456 TaxID=1736539 RepID=UPI0006F93EFE|nr:LLM class flavin-dependent oxidoreductase [Angustibacter sp. Root456]KQX61931.1 5,10-methylene tetrahydromethanopterin reductase [Angustibacter sp. Root456]